MVMPRAAENRLLFNAQDGSENKPVLKRLSELTGERGGFSGKERARRLSQFRNPSKA